MEVRMKAENRKTELEEFLKNNPRREVWFATSTVLLKGVIGTTLETDHEKLVDIKNCSFMSVENQPSISKFTVKIDDIKGWGLA